MRPLLLSTLLLTSSPNIGLADWCSGYWVAGFFEMKLSDRVEKASNALQNNQSKLQNAITRMRLDTESNFKRLQQHTQQQQTRLYEDTLAICFDTQSEQFPIHYAGASLQDLEQAKAQLRLNLGLYQAYDAVGKQLKKRIEQQKQLSHSMSSKFHELSVLTQQMTSVRGFEGTVPQAKRFVQTACLAIESGEALLAAMPVDTLEEMMAAQLTKEQKPANEQQVTSLLDDCKSLARPKHFSPSGWFTRLLTD